MNKLNGYLPSDYLYDGAAWFVWETAATMLEETNNDILNILLDMLS